MRQAFDNIVKKLKQDEFCCISVTDDHTYTKLLASTPGKELINKNGSIENYFGNLVKNGHTKIGIQEYRKNGHGIKKIGVPIRLNLSQKEEKVVDSVVSSSNATANPLGLAGSMGLGWTDVVNLTADSRDKDRLFIENGFLKTENEALKKRVEELREEQLENKYNSDSKTGQMDLIGKLITSVPMLMGAFTKAPSGLNSPASNVPQLSDIKNQMVQIISDATFSDVMVGVLFNIIHKINTEPAFYTDLETLLQPKE